jgi:hypothetical protein
MRRVKQAAIVIVFVAAQLVRPDRANPPTDASRTIQAHPGTTSGLTAVNQPLMQRLPLEPDRLAVVYAGRSSVLADGVRRG